MIRLFTALPLPDDVRARLATLSGGIDGARWVAPENLHVTLRFIGEVAEHRIDDIVPALAGLRTPLVTVTLEETGHFGSRGKARSIWRPRSGPRFFNMLTSLFSISLNLSCSS